jgi:hypothetical protein
MENRRLLEDLRRANRFLEAVMDRLDTGAIALDPSGVVQAVNKPACHYLNLGRDPRGELLAEVLAEESLAHLAEMIPRLAEAHGGSFEDIELPVDGTPHKLRVSAQTLTEGEREGEPIGRVILFREVSHEPLRRRFDEVLDALGQQEGGIREDLETAIGELRSLNATVESTGVASAGMAELSERASRTQTAMQNWLDVDDLLAREDYPDAQLLLDRMRVATERWPQKDSLPERVAELARRVDAYYESGENAKQRVL